MIPAVKMIQTRSGFAMLQLVGDVNRPTFLMVSFAPTERECRTLALQYLAAFGKAITLAEPVPNTDLEVEQLVFKIANL